MKIKILLFGLLLGCSVFLLFGYGGKKASQKLLTVVTHNMGTFKGKKPDTQKVIYALSKDAIPDVLLLQEVPSEQEAHDIGSKLSLPHCVFSAYSQKGKSGLAILSRFSLSHPELLKHNAYASFSAQMEYEGVPVLLCSVHLERIRPIQLAEDAANITWPEFWRIVKSEVLAENPRSQEVAQLLPWLALKNTKRAIIGGDFNTFPFSKAIREMNRHYNDAMWPSLNYLSTSYSKVHFLLKPRIDFIFHSADVGCISAHVIKESAGDHYPVYAVFGFLS